jgi:predicted TIM-barrel fold metal-dependent hydrolase
MTATLTAIDCDGHFLEHSSDIVKYLEGPWKGRKTPLWPGDQPWDSSLGDTIGHPYDYVRQLSAVDQVKLWHRILDENEIEQAVLFPTGSGSITKLQEVDFSIAAARATNNHFAADYADKRLKPIGILPMRNAQAAADELRRAVKDLHLVGFEILTSGLPFALGDPYYDPIYTAAEETGAAICVHGTRSGASEFGAGNLTTFGEVHAYAFVAGMLKQFTSIMGQGVPVRFPKLKLAFLEIGATWLPYYLDRLDEHWEKRGHVDMPLLKEKPTTVFAKSGIKVSIEAGETLLTETIGVVGVQHLMYATDVPHWDCEFPENLVHLRGDSRLNDEQKHQILYSNAKAFYNL